MKSIYPLIMLAITMSAQDIACSYLSDRSSNEPLQVNTYKNYSSTCQNDACVAETVVSTPIITLKKIDGIITHTISITDWSTGKLNEIVSVASYIEQIALSDSKEKLCFFAGKKLYVYDIASKSKIFECDHAESVKNMMIFDDLHQLVVLSKQSISIFNLNNQSKKNIDLVSDCWTFNNNQQRLFVGQGPVVKKYALAGFYCFKKYEHQETVVSVDCSKDGQHLLTCDMLGVLRVWGVADQSILKEHKPNSKKYSKAFFSPDMTYIFAVTREYKIDVLDAMNFAPILLDIGGKYYDFKEPYIENNAIVSFNDPYNISVAILNKSFN